MIRLPELNATPLNWPFRVCSQLAAQGRVHEDHHADPAIETGRAPNWGPSLLQFRLGQPIHFQTVSAPGSRGFFKTVCAGSKPVPLVLQQFHRKMFDGIYFWGVGQPSLFKQVCNPYGIINNDLAKLHVHYNIFYNYYIILNYHEHNYI